ncbi:hypothetical protein GYMLUDRAFT_50706 [Collybiopsis luxurians FD-317 M1]|uniref:Uncharacterized protein n=1 Tax=Collybiopsis luxurians FD-317 M1 TaxID=944289 RepID=A0A0D0C8U6_9AGAR|nr:hypothetical protein GYMLUDRAFT_50706 [Collybiopsis luxurians FD-317 M1]
MRFFSTLLSLFALATSTVMAQGAGILSPPDMTQVPAGSTFDVSIGQPDSISSWENIALVIGLANCAQFISPSTCLGPDQELGTIIYNGPFNPKFTTDPGTGGLPPHQNFTLTVPADFKKGQTQLGAALFVLVGALLFPTVETFNTTIVVT